MYHLMTAHRDGSWKYPLARRLWELYCMETKGHSLHGRIRLAGSVLVGCSHRSSTRKSTMLASNVPLSSLHQRWCSRDLQKLGSPKWQLLAAHTKFEVTAVDFGKTTSSYCSSFKLDPTKSQRCRSEGMRIAHAIVPRNANNSTAVAAVPLATNSR